MPSFRLKRGNTEKVGAYVGTSGELIYNTETKKVVVMDGVNAGGITLGGSEVVDVNNPPAFQKVLGSSLLTPWENGNKLELYSGGHTLAIQQNQDTIYWVTSTNSGYDTDGTIGTNAIYSVSKNDFNGWLATVEYAAGFTSPPISDLPSYKVFSGADWWTWMDNNGGRGNASIAKRHPVIFIDKQSTGANPVAYLIFREEKRLSNSSKDGRTFIATGSNLENLQELLIPTINNQFPGAPAFVDANAGGAFDVDYTQGINDMDANFWGSTTGPTFVIANSTHIFVMIQWWGINVYAKDGTYVKTLKHPVLGFYNSGWNWGYLDSRQNYPAAGMFCTDDRLVVITAEDGMAWNYYQNMNATYRDAAPGTLQAAQFDMFWGEIAVYTGDGTYINTIKNPMPRQNGEYNYFANSPFESVNLLSNNILTVYNTESQLIDNGFGATNGIADGTISFEEGAVHIYDMNTLTHINTVYNTTDPDIVGDTWTWAYKQAPGPRAIPDGTNDCILIIATDGKDTWHAVRGSTGEVLDTITDVPDDPENDWWGNGSSYAWGAVEHDFGATTIQLADGTVVMSSVYNRKPPQALIFKLAGELTSKLKLGDNKFLKLPTDSSFELDITKTKLSDFTNDVGFALGSQIPTVPTNLSSFTNDAGFAVGTIPTALSELTNDSGFATTAQIPTALSQLTNDSGFAIGTIPTALSELTNDVGFSTGGGGGSVSIEHHLQTTSLTIGPSANGSFVTVISHTFTAIPEGAKVLITVSGDIFWDSGNAYPPGGYFYFTPDGVRDTTFQRLIWGAYNPTLGLASSTYQLSYKPITVSGGSLTMAVEFQQNSDWRARFSESNRPTLLHAMIIG